MIAVTFRPIDQWPGTMTRDADRQFSPFSAAWPDTLDLLDRELFKLDAAQVVVQLALGESDIRLDGWPRASANPEHPGVILAFDSVHGPLKYVTDRFRGRSGTPGWQANLRAVALGLEALRKVDRYGITKRGEQYTGWRALPAGIAMGPAMTLEEAAGLIYPDDPDWIVEVGDEDDVRREYRHQAKRHHPDQGGDADEFRRLGEARDMLLGHVEGRRLTPSTWNTPTTRGVARRA